MSQGDAVLITSGPGMHIFVVINTPAPIPNYGIANQCVLVSFSTIHEEVPHDEACIVHPGVHPFITSPSYAVYRDTRIYREDALCRGVDNGTFVRRPPPFEAQVVDELRAGLRTSRKVKREFKNLEI